MKGYGHQDLHTLVNLRKQPFAKQKSKQNLESEQWGWFIGSVSIYIYTCYFTVLLSLTYKFLSNPRFAPLWILSNLEALLIELTNAIHGLQKRKLKMPPKFSTHMKIIPCQVFFSHKFVYIFAKTALSKKTCVHKVAPKNLFLFHSLLKHATCHVPPQAFHINGRFVSIAVPHHYSTVINRKSIKCIDKNMIKNMVQAW